MQIPLDEQTREQRRLLFGKNEIDIEGKSTISLLVDEVHSYLSNQIFFLISLRSFTPSMYSKLLVSSYGLWMTTITMHFALPLFP
jgi:hypothetical protein